MEEKQGVKADYLSVLFGVSVGVVHSLARRGVVLKKPEPNCFALLAESMRAYCTHLPEMAAGNGTERMAQSVERARLEQIAGRCSGAAVRRGALVDIEGVAAEWSGFCARFAPEC
jgi:phage terminase Nu1 subunit (DNA packaging protein)